MRQPQIPARGLFCYNSCDRSNQQRERGSLPAFVVAGPYLPLEEKTTWSKLRFQSLDKSSPVTVEALEYPEISCRRNRVG